MTRRARKAIVGRNLRDLGRRDGTAGDPHRRARLADSFADRLDWHALASLVDRGCPLHLALDIVL
jgi:hypothetical protein